MASLDVNLFQFFVQFAEKYYFFNFLYVFCATYLPVFIVLAGVLFIFREKNKKKRFYILIFLLLLILLSRGIFTEVLQFIVSKDRPFVSLGLTPLFEVFGNSFPSGHAAFLFALAFGIWRFRRNSGIWFLVLAFINSITRVIAGVHWPSDILGGIIIAFISFLILDYVFEKSFSKEKFGIVDVGANIAKKS